MPTDDISKSLDEAQELCIETMGRLAEFWGFTRTMGRVWGALFLSDAPRTQAEIVEWLGVSTANVSMSLNGLIRWGAVHKVYEKGSRKHHYEAEPELRKIIRNVLGAREARELRGAVERFSDASEILRGGRRRRKLSASERFSLQRMEHLQNVLSLSNRMLDMLLGSGQVDVLAELGEK